MHIYLEIVEKLSEDESMVKQPQELRIEVSSKEEAVKKYEELKHLFARVSYVARVHYHYHDEGKPCEVEVIEET